MILGPHPVRSAPPSQRNTPGRSDAIVDSRDRERVLSTLRDHREVMEITQEQMIT